MNEPKLIRSPLSRTVSRENRTVQIKIYRLEHTAWSLEIVAEDGNSTVWDDPFEPDQEALAEALQAIKDDGIASFSEEVAPKRTLH